MTEEIKNRLEQIWAGKVPIGYYTSGGYVIPSDWKLVPLQNCFSRLTRKNEENNENVLTISAQQGLVNQMEYYNNSYASEDKRGYSLLYKGDYSYNKSYSSDYPYGAIKRLEKYDKGVVSPLYMCFEPKKSTNSDFYIQYFEAGIFNREIYKIAQEGARNHGLLNVAVDDFFVSSILYPPIPEQKKIAEILMQCDKVITLKKERIEEEKKRKKWLMKKLLVPDIGTKYGTQSAQWRKVSIDEIGAVVTGGTPPTANQQYYKNGIYPWVTPSDISSKYISETERKLSEKGLSVARKLPANTLLVTCIASIGKNAILRSEGSCNQQINAVIMNSGFDTEFIYYAIAYKKRNFLRLAGITATPIINARVFGKMRFDVPTYDVQIAIARVLSKQDDNIELLEQEVNQWQQKKKALTQLLLTGIVRV